jgi:hypothetical protein
MHSPSGTAERQGVGRAGEGAWCPEMLDCGAWRMPGRSAHSLSRHVPGVLMRMLRVKAASNVRRVPGVLKWMPGVVICMPGVEASVTTRHRPGVRFHMPGRSAHSAARHVPGVLEHRPGELMPMPGRSARSDSRHLPRQIALGRDQPACPAQPGIAVDRFAREIGGILRGAT